MVQQRCHESMTDFGSREAVMFHTLLCLIAMFVHYRYMYPPKAGRVAYVHGQWSCGWTHVGHERIPESKCWACIHAWYSWGWAWLKRTLCNFLPTSKLSVKAQRATVLKGPGENTVGARVPHTNTVIASRENHLIRIMRCQQFSVWNMSETFSKYQFYCRCLFLLGSIVATSLHLCTILVKQFCLFTGITLVAIIPSLLPPPECKHRRRDNGMAGIMMTLST